MKHIQSVSRGALIALQFKQQIAQVCVGYSQLWFFPRYMKQQHNFVRHLRTSTYVKKSKVNCVNRYSGSIHANTANNPLGRQSDTDTSEWLDTIREEIQTQLGSQASKQRSIGTNTTVNVLHCHTKTELFNNHFSFEQLGIHPILIERLKKLGILHPTNIQLHSIPLILQGHDCTLIAPTGSGKSLTYILPIIQQIYTLHDIVNVSRDNAESWDNPLCHIRPSVILQGTRDLCCQTIQLIQELDPHGVISIQSLIPFTDFPKSRSGNSDSQQLMEFSDMIINKKLSSVIVNPRICWGAVDFVISTPQHFLSELSRFTGTPVLPSCIVLDEIDALLSGTVSENLVLDVIKAIRPPPSEENRSMIPYSSNKATSHTPSQQHISSTDTHLGSSIGPSDFLGSIPHNEISPTQFIFSGATIPDCRNNCAGQRIIKRWPTAQSSWSPDIHRVGTYGSLTEAWICIDSNDFQLKLETLSHIIIKQKKIIKTIILVNSIKRCQELYAFLIKMNWPVVVMHQGIRSSERMLNIDKLCKGDIPFLVGTDMAGRGFDYYNVDHIINFDFPTNAQIYIHRCGRAGRAGKLGQITNIVTPEDAVIVAKIRGLQRNDCSLDSSFSRKRSLNARTDNDIEKFLFTKERPVTTTERITGTVKKIKLSPAAKAKIWKQEVLKDKLSTSAKEALEMSPKYIKLKRLLSNSTKPTNHSEPCNDYDLSNKLFAKPDIQQSIIPELSSVTIGTVNLSINPINVINSKITKPETDSLKKKSGIYQPKAFFGVDQKIQQIQSKTEDAAENHLQDNVSWESLHYKEDNEAEWVTESTPHRVSMAAAPLNAAKITGMKLGFRRGAKSLCGLGMRQFKDFDNLDTLLGT